MTEQSKPVREWQELVTEFTKHTQTCMEKLTAIQETQADSINNLLKIGTALKDRMEKVERKLNQ